MVGIFDGDYASLTFSHEDPAKGQVYYQALYQRRGYQSAGYAANATIIARGGSGISPSLCPYVLAEIGRADFWVSAIESLIRKLLPTTGLMTEAEANTWADTLLQDSEAGVFFFFGASNYYSYVAKRP